MTRMVPFRNRSHLRHLLFHLYHLRIHLDGGGAALLQHDARNGDGPLRPGLELV